MELSGIRTVLWTVYTKRVAVMKRKVQKSNFKYYYNLIFSHGVCTKTNRQWKKRIAFMVGFDIFCIIDFILVCKNSQSKIVQWLFDYSKTEYKFFLAFFFYYILIITSMVIYHSVSLFYEYKHGHELCKKDIRGFGPKIIYCLHVIIHFPWIFSICIILRILKKCKIENLAILLPMIVAGYFIFAVLILETISLGIRFLTGLISKGFSLGVYFTERTYLFFIVFFSIAIGKGLSYFIVKKFINMYTASNRMENKKLFKQYELLNDYLMIIATFFLKALDFTDGYQYLVDALFYTTTILTLMSAAKGKALEC